MAQVAVSVTTEHPDTGAHGASRRAAPGAATGGGGHLGELERRLEPFVFLLQGTRRARSRHGRAARPFARPSTAPVRAHRVRRACRSSPERHALAPFEALNQIGWRGRCACVRAAS